MAKRGSEDATVVAESAAAIVARLDERLTEVTRKIQQHVMSEIAEMREDAQLLELLRESVEQNVDTVLSAIRLAIPIDHVEPPAAAVEHARRLAQRGVSGTALVRAYRLGQQTLLDIVLDELRVSDIDPRRSLDVFQQISVTTFRYIDRISQQVISAYQSERDRWLETQNSSRALRVRELLDADTVDVDAVSTAIGYPLRRLHLALVVWYPEPHQGDELVHMERFIRGIAESLGSQGRPLFVAADRVTGFGWVPLAAEAAPDAVARVRKLADADNQPCVAVGDPLLGVDGFRRSHQQALSAHAVAVAAGGPAARVIANDDPGLSAAALLGDNVDAARVWVGEVLGPLASASEGDERLRETLQVFLRTGCSYKAAARELNLHFNTVKYRVERAEQRRGRPITADRLEVELALLLCHWFRGAVLR